jgi:hypothetical protein
MKPEQEKTGDFAKAIEKLDAESFGNISKIIEREAKRRRGDGKRAGEMTAREFEAWKDEQMADAAVASHADMLRRQVNPSRKRGANKEGEDDE